MRPLVKLILDKRHLNKGNKYPVKLRITHKRVQRLFKLNMAMTELEFNEVMKEKPKKEFRDLRAALDLIDRKVWTIIDALPVFSIPQFSIQFKGLNKKTLNVYSVYDDYIKQLTKEGRLKTAISYESSKNSLLSFKRSLDFEDITKAFLTEYESKMLKDGKSVTTVGIYIRSLRAIYNYAIDNAVIKRDGNYPFGKRKYQIPASRNIKKALSEEEFKLVRDYKIRNNQTWWYYKDLWLFSFYCQGMNMKDISFLKYRNIDTEYIRFTREKTKRTTKASSNVISVFIIPEIREIIDRWGVNTSDPEAYIFPILSKDLSIASQIATLGQTIKNINACMRRVANDIGLKKPLTTYVARHTFATLSRNKGVPTEYISESLGHTTLATTKRYLDSFDDEAKRNYSHILRFL